MVSLISFIASYYTFRALEQGIAHSLGLVTLRHGTNLVSWLGIHTIGALPQMGNSPMGGDYGTRYTHNGANENRFYFALESAHFDQNSWSNRFLIWIPLPLYSRLVMRAIPKEYTFLSSINLVERVTGIEFSKGNRYSKEKKLQLIVLRMIRFSIGVLGCLSLPNIKFHFSPEQVESFEPDQSPDLYSRACSTQNYFSPLNCGILGCIYNGLSWKLPGRLLGDPARVITGLALIALSSLVIYGSVTYYAAFLTTQRTTLLAGAILAII